MLAGSTEDSPTIMSVKKIPIESTWAEFWKVVVIPEPAPRCSGGRLFITAARLGDMNKPLLRPIMRSNGANDPVVEVDREQLEQDEAERGEQHAAGGERPGAVAVGQYPGDRPGDEEPDGEGQHVDAGPQRGAGEVVAVQRQPDPLQPDDQHEHEAAPPDGGQEAGEGPGGEGADAEERQPEHRLGRPSLDDGEGDQQRDADS